MYMHSRKAQVAAGAAKTAPEVVVMRGAGSAAFISAFPLHMSVRQKVTNWKQHKVTATHRRQEILESRHARRLRLSAG